MDCTVKLVKEWLTEYRDNEREIDNQIERLSNLVTRMTSVEAQCISDMPSSHDSFGDRLADYVNRKIELEECVKELIEKQNNTRNLIEEAVKTFSSADERAVIRMRYIDALPWAAVNEMLFGALDDFEDKEESYMRRAQQSHGFALNHIIEYFNLYPEKWNNR